MLRQMVQHERVAGCPVTCRARLQAVARIRALCEGARSWADETECADATDAARFARLARRAAVHAGKELERARQNHLGEAIMEVMQMFASCAQDHAAEAILMATQAPRTPRVSRTLNRLRTAGHAALFVSPASCDQFQRKAHVGLAARCAVYAWVGLSIHQARMACQTPLEEELTARCAGLPVESVAYEGASVDVLTA